MCKIHQICNPLTQNNFLAFTFCAQAVFKLFENTYTPAPPSFKNSIFTISCSFYIIIIQIINIDQILRSSIRCAKLRAICSVFYTPCIVLYNPLRIPDLSHTSFIHENIGKNLQVIIPFPAF